MNNGLIISFLLLFVFIVVGFTLSMLTSIIFSPVFHTPKEVIPEILKYMKLKKEEIFYDLGSGDGRMPIYAKKIAGTRGFGYDISPMIVIYSKFNRLFKLGITSDVLFDTANIFDLKLNKADVIYIFQTEKILKILSKKFKKELKDVRVYSYRDPLPDTKEKKKYELSNGKMLYEYTY